VYSSVVGGLRNEIPILPQLLLAVSQLCRGNTLLFSAAQIMGPTILPQLLLAVSITLPVCIAHPWSAACAMKATNTAAVAVGCPATLPVAITLLFSAAQIMANNTAAVATGGVNNSVVCVLIRGRRLP
jgi:hypothetical protein